MLVRWINPFFEFEKANRGFFPSLFIPVNWEYGTNVINSDKEFSIEIEVPGIKRENLTINVEDDILVITGEKKHKDVVKSFTKSYSLPEDIDVEKVSALLENELLLIKVPKLPKKVPKKIEIKFRKSE